MGGHWLVSQYCKQRFSDKSEK
ncbi:hypothetical protein CBM2597_A110152 [Cupriavidus taiwanensis]|uniref:Uncharacterized protein n=1 Tax=Cupriavidus taiwanensis TaxID=164546 RepID=A0A7Z7JD08_9BURK|nr:hypothetical protein CBM2597_A110152 [Cupriavidus taiwanensis]SPC18894.1 hypothetical protein CBM2594_A80333 [Cupriavidus taiwanensis]